MPDEREMAGTKDSLCPLGQESPIRANTLVVPKTSKCLVYTPTFDPLQPEVD